MDDKVHGKVHDPYPSLLSLSHGRDGRDIILSVIRLIIPVSHYIIDRNYSQVHFSFCPFHNDSLFSRWILTSIVSKVEVR